MPTPLLCLSSARSRLENSKGMKLWEMRSLLAVGGDSDMRSAISIARATSWAVRMSQEMLKRCWTSRRQRITPVSRSKVVGTWETSSVWETQKPRSVRTSIRICGKSQSMT